MDNKFFNEYPYTDFHELNLSWVIQELRAFATTLEQFVSINALKYADPIQWNITSQYEKNTIVIDPLTGTAYISVQPVPSGVAITNTDYWTVVFDLGSFVVRAAKNFTDKWEPETTLTATFSSNINDWIIWGDTLYRVLSPIVAGDQYVDGSNIVHFTAEDVMGHIQELNTTDKSNLVSAINEVLNTLIDTTGDLDNLTTIDKSNLVAAINEVLNTLIVTTGDLDNLTTIDKSNLVAAINEIEGVQHSHSSKINSLLAYRDFIGQRYASKSDIGYGVQAITKYNNDYIVAYEIDASHFGLATLSNTMNVTGSYIYNHSAHPNAIFIYNGDLYVVDSTNSIVYKILLSDFSILEINTTFTGNSIFSGCVDENGDAYLQGTSIYKFDGSSIETLCTLGDYTLTANTVVQGSFIYNKNIYLICNEPNMLVVFDFDGNCLGVKDIGLGDGYYPYGEIEGFSIIDGDIVMLTAYYFSNVDIPLSDAIIMNLFKTNFINELTNNSRYGQALPTIDTIHINEASTAINPDGTIAAPFKSAYEASCIYNYLFTKQQRGYIELATNITKPIILSNIIATIIGNAHSSGVILCRNSDVILVNNKIDKFRAIGGQVSFLKCTITDLSVSLCKIDLDAAVTTTFEAGGSTIYGQLAKVPQNGTLSNVTVIDASTYSNAPMPTTYNPNALIKNILVDSSFYATFDFTFLIIGGGTKNVTSKATVQLTTGNKTTIAGGSAIVKTVSLNAFDNADNPCIVEIEVSFNTDYTITFTAIRAVKTSGGDATISTVYALEGIAKQLRP